MRTARIVPACCLAFCARRSKRVAACACPWQRDWATSLSAIWALSDVRIFATDADEEAVDFARRGVYSEAALSGLSGEQVGRYFTHDDGHYEVKKPVRNAIRHSGADHVFIEFGVTPEAATGSVVDDGRGFRETAENGPDGGGHLRILSFPGEGTRVEVTVPLESNGN